MKKQYMTPQCTVVKLNMQSLLNTGSPFEVSGTDNNAGLTVSGEGGDEDPG